MAGLTQEKLHSQASWWPGHGDSFMDWSPGGHLGLREAPNMSSYIFILVCAPVCVTLLPVLPHFALWVHSYNQLTDSLNYSPCLQIWLLQRITVSRRWALLGSDSLPFANELWLPLTWKKCLRKGLTTASLLKLGLSTLFPKDLMTLYEYNAKFIPIELGLGGSFIQYENKTLLHMGHSVPAMSQW